MMETSEIEVTRKTNPLGKVEQETYKWIGKSPYVYVHAGLFLNLAVSNNVDEIQLGPYKLLKVESYSIGDYFLYVRKDRMGRLHVFLYRATRWLDLIYRRLILTLSVWNLADYNAPCYPSWRDIKMLKRFSK